MTDTINRRAIAATLSRLDGQFATPPGSPRDHIRFIVEHRLAKFHEWPRGYWRITAAGWDFLAESDAESDDA